VKPYFGLPLLTLAAEKCCTLTRQMPEAAGSTPAYRALLADLGVASIADRKKRAEQVKSFLPQLWDTSQAIIATNTVG
jgi:hypothetical protein